MDASQPRLKPKTGADSKSGLAAQRQLQQNEQTKSAERSHDDRTNTNQRDQAGYTSSNKSEQHKRCCGVWFVM